MALKCKAMLPGIAAGINWFYYCGMQDHYSTTIHFGAFIYFIAACCKVIGADQYTPFHVIPGTCIACVVCNWHTGLPVVVAGNRFFKRYPLSQNAPGCTFRPF